MNIHNVLYNAFGIASDSVTNCERYRDLALKEKNIGKIEIIASKMVDILKEKLIQYRGRDDTLGRILFRQEIDELRINKGSDVLHRFLPTDCLGDLVGHGVLEVKMLEKIGILHSHSEGQKNENSTSKKYTFNIKEEISFRHQVYNSNEYRLDAFQIKCGKYILSRLDGSGIKISKIEKCLNDVIAHAKGKFNIPLSIEEQFITHVIAESHKEIMQNATSC